MIGIYKITCLKNNMVYIGQSTCLKTRIRNHKGSLKRSSHTNTHLQNAWNKYGENNFIFEIIEECKGEELNNREVYWIEKYNSFKKGFNRTIGGDDSNKRKIICLNDGKIYNSLMEVELIYNIPNSNLSKVCNGTRRSCGKDKEGTPLIWRYYDDNMRTIYSKEELIKMLKPIYNNRTDFNRIICLNTGKIYDSISDAEKEYGITNIDKCLSKEYKSCGISPKDGKKLRWMRYNIFLESNKTKKDIILEIILSEKITTKVVSILDDFKIFDSLLECADYYGIKYQNIVGVCSNKRQFSIKDKNNNKQSFLYYDKYINFSTKEIQEYLENIKNKIAKRIICVETNKIYNSLQEISKEYNVSNGYLSRVCKNNLEYRGLHFCYLKN